MSGPFHRGIQTGCLIGLAVFALLMLMGKCAQWMEGTT